MRRIIRTQKQDTRLLFDFRKIKTPSLRVLLPVYYFTKVGRFNTKTQINLKKGAKVSAVRRVLDGCVRKLLRFRGRGVQFFIIVDVFRHFPDLYRKISPIN